MPSSRCLLLIALALGMYSQSSAWCTEEDKGKDCFINIRSAAPPQKQRGINFLDGKDSVKAAIALTPLQTSLQVRVDTGEVKHNSKTPQLHVEKDKIGVGTSQPECTLDVLGDQMPAELQLKGTARGAKEGAYSAALHLTDATSSKTWRVSHDLMAETGLSLGYSPNRNNPSLFKKILTLHADAPGECVAVDKDGNLVLSLSDNRRQEASAVNIRKARGRPGTQQIVANGDEIGKVSFQGFDGRQYAPLAELSVRADGGDVKHRSIGSRAALRTLKYGDTELGDRLAFDGNGHGFVTASAFDFKLDSPGELNIDGTQASFKCKALFSEPVEMRNDVYVAKSVTVKGEAQISDTVIVNEGIMKIEGNVESSGHVTTNGNIVTKSAITSHGGLRVEGDTNVQALSVTGNMKVAGHTTFEGNVDIVANGKVKIDGLMNIDESGVSMARNLVVPVVVADGPDLSNFSSGIIVGKAFKARADAEFAKGLVAYGTVKIGSTEEDALDVEGGVVVGQSLAVKQNINADACVSAETLNVSNAAIADSLQTRVLKVREDLAVEGDVKASSSVCINGTLDVQQPATFAEDVTLSQSISVKGRSSFLDSVTVSRPPDIRAASNSAEENAFTVHGSALLSGSLQVVETVDVGGTISAQAGLLLGDFHFTDSSGGLVVRANETEVLSISSDSASTPGGEVSAAAVDGYGVKVAAHKFVIESSNGNSFVLDSKNMSRILAQKGIELETKGVGLSLTNESITLAIGDVVARLDKEVTEVRNAFVSPSIHTARVCSFHTDFCVTATDSGISIAGLEVTKPNASSIYLNGTVQSPSLVADSVVTDKLVATEAAFNSAVSYAVSVKPFEATVIVDSNFVEIVSPESNVSAYVLTLVPLRPTEGTNLYLTNRMNVSFTLETTPRLTELQPGETVALVYQGTHWTELTPTKVSNAKLDDITQLSFSRDVDFGPYDVAVQSVTLRNYTAAKTQLIAALPSGRLLPIETVTVSDGILEVGDVSGFVAHGGINMGGNVLSNVAIINGTLDGITRLDVRSSLSVAMPVVEKSDRRLKTDILALDKAECLDQVNKLQGRTFRLKRDKKSRVQLGFVAQEVQPIIPEAVVQDGESLGIQYTRLVPHLVEAVKALTQRVKALEIELEAVKHQSMAK